MPPEGIPLERVVAVLATLADGREQIGSGYLVGGSLVLTAGHCTRDKATGDLPAGLQVIRATDGAVALANSSEIVVAPEVDVALVPLANVPWALTLPPPVFARVDRTQSGTLRYCAAIGYPLFQRDPDQRARHTAELHGIIYQTDEAETGRLLMRDPVVRPDRFMIPDERSFVAARDGPPSPWGGLSGALVFYGGQAIGVVVEHHPRQGDCAVQLVGFERIAAAAAEPATRELAGKLGLPAAETLSRVSQEPVKPPAEPAEAEGIGRPLEQITDPFALEVHPAITIDAPPEAYGLGSLPLYVERSHDRKLQKVVHDAAAGQSGIAVLIGTSSSGKTRACWESLQILPAGWRLWRPDHPSTAANFLGQVSSRTVIWLDDSHDSYLYTPAGDSGENLARGLHHLIHDPGRAPVLVLDTMWRETWNTLTTKYDRQHQRVCALLTEHVIPVPTAFDNEVDRAKLTEKAAEDPRLAQAMAEAEDDEVTQYLAGVPVLLARYGTAPEGANALIEAAMDARRLGHSYALPLDFLQAAVPAYLNDRQWQRLAGKADWLRQSLDYVSADCRGVRGLLTPMRPGPGSPEASAPCYRLADFLEQRAHSERQACLGPKQLWDALIEHASGPDDCYQLGVAAHRRGLFRVAAALQSRAAASGHPPAAVQLLNSIPSHYTHVIGNTGRWVAERMALNDPPAVAHTLHALQNAGEVSTMAALVERTASQTSVDKPEDVSHFLTILVKADGSQAATILADRAAAQVPLHHAQAVGKLLRVMSTMSADRAVQTLAERAANHCPLSHPENVFHLLRNLRKVGANGAVEILLGRHPARGVSLNQPPQSIAHFLDELHAVGAGDEIITLLSRDPGSEVLLCRPGAVAFLLLKMWKLNASPSLGVLAKRAALHVPLDDTHGVVHLLEVLHEIGQDRDFDVLADRIAAQLPIGKPQCIAILSEALRDARKHQVVRELVARAVTKVTLKNPQGLSNLLRLMQEAGASQEFAMLAHRAATGVPLDNPAGISHLLRAMHVGGAAAPVAVLATRVIQVPTCQPMNMAQLLHALRGTDEDRVIMSLAHRSADEVPLNDPDGVAHLLYALRKLGEIQAIDHLLDRVPAEHVSMDHAEGIAHLLVALKKVAAAEPLARLAHRTADEVSLSSPEGVARLLVTLNKIAAAEPLARLAHRTADEAPLNDPDGVAHLLDALWKLGETQAINQLIARNPARVVHLDDVESVAHIRDAFQEVDATGEVNTLLTRAADAGTQGMFDQFIRTTVSSATAIDQFLELGRECDGTVSTPWISSLPW